MGENETEIDCVDKERTPMVYSKCDGNPWGVSTCLIDNRYGQEANKEGSEKDMCCEKKDVKIRMRFVENVAKLVDVCATNICLK